MKNILISIFVSIFITFLIGFTGMIETTYTREGYIAKIDDNYNITIIDYATENRWVYNDNKHNYNLYDDVKMYMYNGHTDNDIYDDEIVKVVLK